MATRTARNYLVRKDNTTSYYYRSIIPKDLIPLLERKEFRVSLRTGLLSEGKKLSLECHALVGQIYDHIRSTRFQDGHTYVGNNIKHLSRFLLTKLENKTVLLQTELEKISVCVSEYA